MIEKNIYKDAINKKMVEIGRGNSVFMEYRKCPNPSCCWECPRDRAIEYHYCVKCGTLLPYREKVHIIGDSDYKRLTEKAEMSAWEKIKSIL